jgi:uncharacterized protein (DUF433 family)
LDTVQDFEDILDLFDRFGVRYLIIGGLAFTFHAKPYNKEYRKECRVSRDRSEAKTICYAHLMRTDWRTRVEIREDLHHGDPCIRGTRVPVRTIIGSLADGMSVEEIREAYPQLGPEDVSAALAYAAEVLKDDVLIPLSA